jgi:hypothetical protein
MYSFLIYAYNKMYGYDGLLFEYGTPDGRKDDDVPAGQTLL